jgi:hypothetical protein
MSTTVKNALVAQGKGPQNGIVKGDKPASSQNYKGFVAGVFSGMAKLSGEYSFTVP